MDSRMRDLHCQHIQSDEIWTFVGKKQRHVRKDDPEELGDAWVFVAIDAETKLIPALRSASAAQLLRMLLLAIWRTA